MQTLSHLDKLEAEAIYILREVAAEPGYDRFSRLHHAEVRT